MPEFPSAQDIFEMKFPSNLRPFKRKRELGRVAAAIIEGAPRDEQFEEQASKAIKSIAQLAALSYYREAAELRLGLREEKAKNEAAIADARIAISGAQDEMYFVSTGVPDRSAQPTLPGLELPEQGEI